MVRHLPPRHRSLAVAVAVLVAAGLAPAGADALGTLKGEDASLSARGSLRLLGAFLHYRDLPPPFPDGDDGLAGAELRLLLDGQAPGKVGYEINLFADVSRGPSSEAAGAFSTAGSFALTPYRTRYLHLDYWEDGAVRGQMGVDRLRVRRRFGRVELTAGRFPVNHSVAAVFAPNDFFAPFSATTVNRSYKPGVDAVQVSLGLGELSGFDITGVLGSDADGVPAWEQSAVLAHLETVLGGFQFAALGGKLAERWILGASFQGDIHGVVLRGEGHVGFPDRDGDGRFEGEVHERVSLGVEYTFDWQSLTLGAEYAFFSDGAADPAGYLDKVARRFPDDLPYLGRHYAALTVSGEILPILRLALMGMVNARDGSGLGVLTLLYNVADEVDLVGGVIAGWGTLPVASDAGRPMIQSEFGATPVALFLETRVSF